MFLVTKLIVFWIDRLSCCINIFPQFLMNISILLSQNKYQWAHIISSTYGISLERMYFSTFICSANFRSVYPKYLGPGVAYWLRRCATSRTVPGSIPSDVTWDFFRGSFRQNYVPWGRLSLWKWVLGISPGVKAAGAFGWRPTTLVMPKVKKIRGLNLPGTPRATSACRGIPLLYFYIQNIHPNLLYNHMRMWCYS